MMTADRPGGVPGGPTKNLKYPIVGYRTGNAWIRSIFNFDGSLARNVLNVLAGPHASAPAIVPALRKNARLVWDFAQYISFIRVL